MVRRSCLIVQIALVGVLAVLALPSSSSALLAGIPILLTANGPSPAVQTVPAGTYAYWINQDTVTHTVSFATGCSFQVAPNERGQCNGVSEVVGTYAYTVDGTTQASIVVTPERRTVTLSARSHSIRRGSELMLHGKLAVATLSPPTFEGPRQPVLVIARPNPHHPFYRVAVVTAKPHRSHNLDHVYSVWRLRVRPRASTTYVVVANSQPRRGQYWQRALSKPFRVRVHRS